MQFSQTMSVILRRCRAIRPPESVAGETDQSESVHSGRTNGTNKAGPIGSGNRLSIHRICSIASCCHLPARSFSPLNRFLRILTPPDSSLCAEGVNKLKKLAEFANAHLAGRLPEYDKATVNARR